MSEVRRIIEFDRDSLITFEQLNWTLSGVCAGCDVPAVFTFWLCVTGATIRATSLVPSIIVYQIYVVPESILKAGARVAKEEALESHLLRNEESDPPDTQR